MYKSCRARQDEPVFPIWLGRREAPVCATQSSSSTSDLLALHYLEAWPPALHLPHHTPSIATHKEILTSNTKPISIQLAVFKSALKMTCSLCIMSMSSSEARVSSGVKTV